MQRDVEYGEFDPTYQKYRIQNPESVSEALGKVAKPESKLLALWERYVGYLTPKASPKTINDTYNPVTAHIGRCKTDGLVDPLKFRQELLKVTTQSQARRTLMQLSAVCNWGVEHKLVASNPFQGYVGSNYVPATCGLFCGGARSHHRSL